MRALPLLVLVGCAGCLQPSWQPDLDRLMSDLEAIQVRHRDAPPGPATDPELDRLLSGPLEVETLVAIARQRHPELREAHERARAALAAVRGATSLEDPMLAAHAETVPLRQPVAFDRDEFNSLGIEQKIPFPGNLGLAGEAALREAESMIQEYRGRERDVVARVKRAYYEYFAIAREIAVHLEHVRILEEFEKSAAARYRTGLVTQQDVLKPQVELVMLHNDVLVLEQKLVTAKSAINLLLNRPDDAPLGPPRDPAATDERFDVKALQNRALQERPDVKAGEARVRAAKAERELADREAGLPNFSVGLSYMQMPERDDAWAGTIGINLPWITGKRSAEAERRGHAERAEELALEAVRSRVLFEVREAWQRVEAARKSIILLKGELLPKSGQSVEVSRAAYEKERASFLDLLDAERAERDVKLKHYQALAEYEAAVADLERAVGTDVRRRP